MRQVGTKAAQGSRSAADRTSRGGGSRAAIGVLAAPALVQGQGQGVDVRLGAGRLTLSLLWRHVGEGADDVAWGGQSGGLREARDTEIHQLGAELPLGRDDDVLRLDVAVNDAARMGMVERLAEVRADLTYLAVAEGALATEPGQRPALDQLGDEQGVAVLLPHLVEGDDAWVVEARCGLGLAQDPFPGLPSRFDRLDRDSALEAPVPGLVDHAEAAAAYAALDQETVEDEGADHELYPTSSRIRFLLRHTACYLEDSLASRPGRRPRPPRRPERQQILLRRGLALGAGLLVLILLVLGVRGCLNARKERALSDYAGNVTQIVEETDQTSKSFFEKLSDPGSLSVTDFVAEVNADRSAMDNYASRIDALDTPGDMGNAQDTLELVYELRGSAMTEIADKVSTALGDVGSEKATAAIANQMGKLYASDVLYATVARPEIDGVLADNGIEGEDVPESIFVPDGTQWLDEDAIAEALAGVSGSTSAATPGVHGLGLLATYVNGTELTPEGTTSVTAEETPEVEVEVQNQGESTENGVTVSVTVNGKTLAGDISSIEAGATETVVIPLTPAPQGEATLEVEAEPVPGEEVSENNEASYTVVFE